MPPSHITIIGAGHAASELVAALHADGYTGGLRLIGDERHLPYQRPPLSKKFLAGEAGIEAVTLRPRDLYEREGAELVLGVEATDIDRGARRITLADGRTFGYEALVFATGTRARPLPVPGAGLRGVHVLRGIDDSLALKAALTPGKRFVVIGGGYIGLEAAATAVKLGAKVTVIEALPRLMARVASPELADHMLAVHRSHGVEVRLSTAVQALRGSGRDGVDGVVIAHGEVVPADVVLVGIGALPNVELASAAGLTVDNGIVVDEFMQTSDPAILAIGDCTNHPSRQCGGRIRLESVQGAVDQAVTAAKTLMGKLEPYDRVPWFWSDQFDERLQMAGIAAQGDETVVRRYPDARQLAIFRTRAGKLTAVEAINSSKDYMAGRRVIEMGKTVSAELLADPKIGPKQLMA
jgi:3-phenylpropionate/trans-cinnamate dioxygenase ferredoxin reductase component